MKRPFYNMVVADSRARRDGRFIERIGFYNPQAAGKEQSLQIATDRLSYWQQQGAQVSPTVARLLKQLPRRQPKPCICASLPDFTPIAASEDAPGDIIVLGKVAAACGLHGEVRVNPYADPPGLGNCLTGGSVERAMLPICGVRRS